MPGTFGNNRSLGYAFVNLINVETMKDWAMTFGLSEFFCNDRIFLQRMS